jgi:hypothetical protein
VFTGFLDVVRTFEEAGEDEVGESIVGMFVQNSPGIVGQPLANLLAAVQVAELDAGSGGIGRRPKRALVEARGQRLLSVAEGNGTQESQASPSFSGVGYQIDALPARRLNVPLRQIPSSRFRAGDQPVSTSIKPLAII